MTFLQFNSSSVFFEKSHTFHKTFMVLQDLAYALSCAITLHLHGTSTRSLVSLCLCTCCSCSSHALPLSFVKVSQAHSMASSDPLGSDTPSSELPELLVIPLLALMSLT